eukprot:8716828-Pyramimonas_sp.AAC.1
MAPSWPTIPQTPQAAENVGLATVCAFTTGLSTLHSDCKGAIRLHNAAGAAQLGPKHTFAGVRRAAQQAFGFDAA